MEAHRPGWLRDSHSHTELDFDGLVQTLRDLSGREAHVSAPHHDTSKSHLAALGELRETESPMDEAVCFIAGGCRLFMRRDRFDRAERSSADYGDFFWITIETSDGSFFLQDSQSFYEPDFPRLRIPEDG